MLGVVSGCIETQPTAPAKGTRDDLETTVEVVPELAGARGADR
jgi:hypothetical protein